ncbi:hypothetical protein E2C01_068298 [Portunus trituberculatus]|uniref:Uncharacterized protein n=1 Tax=Portunus trituberculatus TaxID=210409 RepID=A0A5B7HVV6_PORTR|nr:hypothetical protein [Portunus trituberculatus]
MDVNARSYRWSESCSKVCQICDMGEDEMVEHVVLECLKYARDRNEMMQVVLRESGNARLEMTEKEWMVLLLGLSGRYKGLTQEQSQVTCNIQVKINIETNG